MLQANGIPDDIDEGQFISPLRGKDYLKQETCLGTSYSDHALSRGKAIVARDYFDVDRAGIVLANFLGAQRVSIGSCCEISRAHAKNKLVVLVMEDEGNLHDHPFLTEAAGFRVNNLRDACRIIQHVTSTGL